MRKQITALLLSLIIAVGMTESVCAFPNAAPLTENGEIPSAEEVTENGEIPSAEEVTETGEIPSEEELTETGIIPGAKETLTKAGELSSAAEFQGKTGYIRPQFIELSESEVPEIYEPSEETVKSKGSAAYRSGWDSYSTNYYYNLLGEPQRNLWDKLDEMCYGYLTGTETLTNKKHYSNISQGLDFDYYMTKAVVFTGMSASEAQNIEFMFMASNPQYYFLQVLFGVTSTGTGGFAYLSVNDSFANGTARKTSTQKIQSVITSWLAQINAQPTELLKEKKIHDLICENVTYDMNYNTLKQNKYNQTIYSVFCTDTTVCAGYSQAMQLLCNAVGIDCAVVTSVDHEWNIIRLNDTWYYVDVTWNDNIADDEKNQDKKLKSAYSYFNRSRQMFLNDDPRNVASHTPEAIWMGYLPELIYDSGATMTEIGTIYTPSATLQAPQITVSGNRVQMTSPNNASIFYTTDGSNPSVAFTKAKKYTGVFEVNDVVKIRAAAVRNAYYDSSVTELSVIPKYTVKFMANGGYIKKKNVKQKTQSVNHQAKLGKLEQPKRKNYAFLGWYTKKSGGSKVSEKTVIKGNQTYYARWAKVKPVKVNIASAKSSSGKLKVKIKKNKKASGYQIRYSLNQNMSSAKTQTTEETSYTIKNLKKGRTYYVQARMYQKESVSGKKKYGAYSKIKAVKIKK